MDVHRDQAIFSGPDVLVSHVQLTELLRKYPDAIAIEMEGQGIYIYSKTIMVAKSYSSTIYMKYDLQHH